MSLTEFETIGHTERRFQAMGTTGHVVVVGDPPMSVGDAVDRVRQLESLWSRFLPDSELSNLNRDRSATVSPETLLLIERAVTGWRATGGRFDPTMRNQLIDSGYDRSFGSGVGDQTTTPNRHRTVARPGAGCAGIVIDRFTGFVGLPPDVTIDPGGIGKGLAADLITAELIEAGADGALVNLGGDLRVRGRPPAGNAWIVDIVEPALDAGPIATVVLRDAGLASSTPLRRGWLGVDGRRHHLLDPTSGTSGDLGPDLVSVVAGNAWWAEVAATALAATGPSVMHADEVDPFESVAAQLVRADGTRCDVGPFDAYRIDDVRRAER